MSRRGQLAEPELKGAKVNLPSRTTGISGTEHYLINATFLVSILPADSSRII